MACDLKGKTGNPICSDDLADLKDNTIIMDQYINSAEFVVSDRLGVPRKTWAGIEKDAQENIDGFEGLINDKIIAQGGVEIVGEFGDSAEKVINQKFLTDFILELHGDTLYVDGENGIDNNSGTELSPLKTINKAVSLKPSTIKIKSGVYNESVEVASRNSKYSLQLQCEAGVKVIASDSYPLHVRDNSKVWVQGGEWDANGKLYAFLCINNSDILLDGAHGYGATRAVSYNSTGSRVRWGNGTILDGQGVCRECVSIYNHSSGGVYGTARNTFKNATIGVEVSGSSYSHTDFIDFENMSFGIKSVHQSHTTNYDNTFTDCTIGWQSEGYSTINTARESLSNVRTRGRAINEMIGVDSNSGVTYNYQQYYPYLGGVGRASIGYTDITTPFGTYQYSLNGESVNFSLSNFGNSFLIDGGKLVLASNDNSAIVFTTSGGYDYSFNLIGGLLALRKDNNNSLLFSESSMRPSPDNYDLGSQLHPFNNIYLKNQPSVSSDARLKKSISNINEKYLEIFNLLDFKQFTMGGSSIHFGIIAQDWIKACEDCGVDPYESGVLVGSEKEGYAIRYGELQNLFNAYLLEKLKMM